jgi:hypothetical protein
MIQGRRISLEEAKKLASEESVLIHWRPEENLPEPEQYALSYNNEEYWVSKNPKRDKDVNS